MNITIVVEAILIAVLVVVAIIETLHNWRDYKLLLGIKEKIDKLYERTRITITLDGPKSGDNDSEGDDDSDDSSDSGQSDDSENKWRDIKIEV
jgi:hypothetical protein